ncbi:hypothetical protein [Halomonas sp. M20]|uniref:hypothetical protein n=1 Tax=Halomonas sp. M20 TaxID=2763264 RepID=UPI001D0A3A2A|nr:hypothetical protein [Halomonas sp. M20]
MSNVKQLYRFDPVRIADAMLSQQHETAPLQVTKRPGSFERMASDRAAKRKLIGIRAVDKSDILDDDGPAIFTADQAKNRMLRARFAGRWYGTEDDTIKVYKAPETL